MSESILPENGLSLVNRGVLTVSPRSPFYTWSADLTPDLELPAAEMNYSTAYLIRDNIGPGSIERVVKKHFQHIFENELSGQWEDEEDWPQERTWELFNEWFEWRFSEMVFDLESDELMKE
ncbi:MAG: hypothetical protein H6581_06085 [Bacteroidia bacterium]|nr:hypothetical protein [Bacteroidia bacterium]